MSSPAPVNLSAALRELNREFGVPFEDLLRTVENALALAYKRQYDAEGFVQARLNPETGELALTATRTSEDGTQTVTPLPVDDFKRSAAHTARRAVMAQLRGIERLQAQEQYAKRYGELATAPVDRIDNTGTVHFDLGHIEGVMPPEDQVPGEQLTPGRAVAFVILEPRSLNRGTPALRVSRAHRLFVQRMLEAEVPEVAAGVIEVRAIAREAGLRTKLAVSSNDPGVDAVGACVGPKGVRHRSLLSDLPHEHVDIVPWSDEPEKLVAAALGPAPVLSVRLDPEARTAHVEVPRDHLSLAIGRDGQNARLAAKLTGWRIDIHPADDAEDPD
ncbi:MAG TPA: transcription termination factor NusA [Candidatus Dormibacteraeota bacterium]